MQLNIRNNSALSASFKNKWFIAGLLFLSGMMISTVQADTFDDGFEVHLNDACNGRVTGVTITLELFVLCQEAFPGGFAGGSSAFSSSSNLGNFSAQTRSSNSLVSTQRGTIKERLEERRSEESGGGASADGGGWGLLVAPMNGKTTRRATDLENGFDSDLSGYVVGIDYRFQDNFVFGVALGSTENEANFVNATGTYKTESDSVTYYMTWSAGNNFSFDFYTGDVDTDYNNSRDIDFGNVTGTISSDAQGTQSLKGYSINYDWVIDSGFSAGVYYAIDSVDTEIDPYNERGAMDNPNLADPNSLGSLLSGETGFELSYPVQTTDSETNTLGFRLNYSSQFSWGSIIPNFRYAKVEEDKDNARTVNTELVQTPGYIFQVQTDAPDRDYSITGYGIVFAMNNGTQIFVDYEQWSGHSFLDSSAVNAGVLVEF